MNVFLQKYVRNSISTVSKSISSSSSNINAFKVHDFRGEGGTKLLISCEHATSDLRPPFQWLDEDRLLKDTHWASDPGANDFSIEFAKMCGSVAVCSTFSRLLCDPNRPLVK
jgi:predicted N-formylglutamate amidohydrolase